MFTGKAADAKKSTGDSVSSTTSTYSFSSSSSSSSPAEDSSSFPSSWQSGFFDHGSFLEIMEPWAKTVICGRARLGGIPVGVVAVETRTVDLEIPADPANINSELRYSNCGLNDSIGSVIAVETSTVDLEIPADPANIN